MDCFKPLQFQDGDLLNAKGRVVTSPRDFARIGWFWMNRGNWNGRQLLPRRFFDQYMSPQVPQSMPVSMTTKADDYLKIGSYGGKPKPAEWGPGKYGFNWWFNVPEGDSATPILPDVPADTILATGIGGNFMILMPGPDLLVAARGDWGHIRTNKERIQLNANLKLLVEAARLTATVAP
jgi:CubicO group peptidase (beta-lactamase class C family)